MRNPNDPILKYKRIEEDYLYTSVCYLLSRTMGIKGRMPHCVRDTLERYKYDYESATQALMEEN